ncbi:MAG: AAA family ATPase [Cytophagales bacterium]|nr:AAA family ATPase [Cytophagales bacterium]
MQFKVELAEIRPIKALTFEIDLARNGLTCLVGKNGTGKTTLAKAILNFALADTFLRTSSDGIFQAESTIRYTWGEQQFLFTYDKELRTLNSKVPIPQALKAKVAVELPVPHGQRFNFFRTLSESDLEIRAAITLGNHRKPTELIEFLSEIYGESRFSGLIEVPLKAGSCCCIVPPDGRYVREDHFSSGEYFLINLHRKILQGQSLLVIDEIDISLDATAQTRVATELRKLCAQHSVNIVFTSHSLAMMQTMEPGEILYIEREAEKAKLDSVAFGYVKSVMFGFKGYDKYILTEDERLKEFLEYLISRYCPPCFFSYVIIAAGGGTEVVRLMDRNEKEEFLNASKNVIAVLDGDQKSKSHALRPNAHCIPVWNVEQAFWDEFQKSEFQSNPKTSIQLPASNARSKPKELYKHVIKNKIYSRDETFKIICDRHVEEFRTFAKTLEAFLCRASSNER